MPDTPGYHFVDGGTTPTSEIANPHDKFRQRILQARKPDTATSKAPLGQGSSTSHILATQKHDIGGAVQKAGKEDGITNLGWQANAKGVDTLVGGLDNDDLWLLIRRFNKACSRPDLRSTTHPLTARRSKRSMSKQSQKHPPAVSI